MSASVIPVRESAAISGPKDPRVIVGDEAVAAAGYNPAIFHAIVPSEAMRGGKVNKNGRIYGSVEAVCAHHLALVNRAREGYVGGEQGHPLETDNPTHPTDAIKILDGSIVAEEDGSVTTTAKVGILKTTAGTDVFTMWLAGKPTGLSLRGLCAEETHVLSESSPYAGMNPGLAGKPAKLRNLISLDTYDAVFDPSFSTFFAPPEGVSATESVVDASDSADIQAAAQRLRASGAVIESPPGRAEQAAQESTMEIKDIAALEAAFPELVKQLRAEAGAQAATEATAAKTQAEADRVRLVAVEAANTDLTTRLAAVESALATERAALARAQVVAEIRTAMESWTKGKPGASVIAEQVTTQLSAGAFAKAEEAVKAADAALAVAEAFVVARGASPGQSVAERAGIVGSEPAKESAEPPPAATPAPTSALGLLATAKG